MIIVLKGVYNNESKFKCGLSLDKQCMDFRSCILIYCNLTFAKNVI